MMLRLAYATGSWLALRSSLRLVRERRRRIGENSIYIPWFRRFRFACPWRARKGCCNRFGAF
jgi:hypothetical protein